MSQKTLDAIADRGGFSVKTWAERAADDPALQEHIRTVVNQAHVELESLRVEVQHWKTVATETARKLKDCQREANAAQKKRR